MNWICKRIYRNQKGFTLVELMVVIIILAVLTGIAIPSYLALRNRARESATRSEMANIGTALELYMADNEAYIIDDTWAGAGNAAATLQAAGYMANVPTADSWGNNYTYTSADPGSTYTLESVGPDGADGGGDDITLTDGILSD